MQLAQCAGPTTALVMEPAEFAGSITAVAMEPTQFVGSITAAVMEETKVVGSITMLLIEPMQSVGSVTAQLVINSVRFSRFIGSVRCFRLLLCLCLFHLFFVVETQVAEASHRMDTAHPHLSLTPGTP